MSLLQRVDAGPVSLSGLKFMFMSISLHEAAHCAVVWYGRRACDSSQLRVIEREGSNFVGKELWVGISDAELSKYFPRTKITLLGITKDGLFFPVGEYF